MDKFACCYTTHPLRHYEICHLWQCGWTLYYDNWNESVEAQKPHGLARKYNNVKFAEYRVKLFQWLGLVNFWKFLVKVIKFYIEPLIYFKLIFAEWLVSFLSTLMRRLPLFHCCLKSIAHKCEICLWASCFASWVIRLDLCRHYTGWLIKMLWNI